MVPALLLAGGAVAQSQFPPRREPGRREGPEEPPKPDPRLLLKHNQKEIKRDAERLFELADQLKKEIEKTDSAEILSLDLVRKAEEIEKLAKRIKSLARG